jgi:SAM-dependent methyltransferase
MKSYGQDLACCDARSPHYARIADLVCAFPVLDVGCGKCTLAHFLPVDQYLGIDPASAPLEVPEARRLPLTVAEGLERLPAGSFGTVIFNEVLYYFEDPLTVINSYRRLLKPGGRMLVSIYHTSRRVSLRSALRSLLHPSRPRSNHHCIRLVKRWLRDQHFTTHSTLDHSIWAVDF